MDDFYAARSGPIPPLPWPTIPPPFSDGKVVAITGASSGIGQATARLLARLGHAVVLGARREPVLATLAAELTGAGDREAYRVTDVTRRADLEALVEHAFAGPTAVGSI